MDDRSHPKCQGPAGHICQEPSGRRCDSQPCDEPAGTWWGPYWCPRHDQERLDRISGQLEDIAASFMPNPKSELLGGRS